MLLLFFSFQNAAGLYHWSQRLGIKDYPAHDGLHSPHKQLYSGTAFIFYNGFLKRVHFCNGVCHWEGYAF